MPFRSPSGFWMHSDKAQLIFGGIIVVNALFIGIDPDQWNEKVVGLQLYWFLCVSVFLVIFLVKTLFLIYLEIILTLFLKENRDVSCAVPTKLWRR